MTKAKELLLMLEFVTYDPVYEGIGSKLKKILVGLGLIASIYGSSGSANAFDLHDIDVNVRTELGSLSNSQRNDIHGDIEVRIPIIQGRMRHAPNPEVRTQLQMQLKGLEIMADMIVDSDRDYRDNRNYRGGDRDHRGDRNHHRGYRHE
jgi:hypothetical protein